MTKTERAEMDEFDFADAPDRRHSDSVKWDVAPGELPMWIADMDLRTAPAIIEAMQGKVATGVFGYEEPHEDYFDAVADWYVREHRARPLTSWMTFCTGVVPAISSIVRRVTNVGDQVLVQEPVYNIFTNSIVNNGRHKLSSDLVYDRTRLTYSVDWADLEAKLAQPLTTLMILCNPHNPTGHVWSRQELERTAGLCLKHHVVLLSDEIHGDLVLQGPDYTPAFSLDESLRGDTITLVSPSKTFNLAALHAATVITPDPYLRALVDRGLNTDELAEPNLLAIPATIAAYTEGSAWLESLKAQLRANRTRLGQALGECRTNVKLVPAQATYLAWLDCTALTSDSGEMCTQLRRRTGLCLSPGSIYGGNGNGFLRMNIACPPSMLEDGLARLTSFLTV